MKSDFLPSFIKLEDVENLQSGTFELYCPSMQLEATDLGGKSQVYTGPGLIKQDSNRQLCFTIFADEKVGQEEILRRWSRHKSGKIIPESEIFSLTAIDFQKRLWTSNRVFPSFNHTHPEKTLCQGLCPKLICKQKKRNISEQIAYEIVLFEKLLFPTNRITKVETIANNQTTYTLNNDILHFQSLGFDFLLQKRMDKITIVQAKTNNSFQDKHLEARILEALQFVFGREIKWGIILKNLSDSVETIMETTHINSEMGNIDPPLNLNTANNQAFTDLFGKYFTFITSSYQGQGYHIISSHIRRVCRSSTSIINTRLLILTTAIEGILKQIHVEYPNESTQTESIKHLQEYIKKWKGSDPLKNQVLNYLNQFDKPSARKQLKYLQKLGVTQKRHVDAWYKHRNIAAHSDSLEEIDIQTLATEHAAILVLMYQLIFYLIGYKGIHTDYSELGWPEKIYNISNASTVKQDNPS
ncbi:MAG: hypothetical protein H6668_19490 [Ardenticatenaceae bacterium]|nr:hypothetical protein [Ardenticatenaceae bacterium]